MNQIEYDEVTATPKLDAVWEVRFKTNPTVLGWVIQSGRFFKAVSRDDGDLGQQMTIKRAAHLVACS